MTRGMDVSPPGWVKAVDHGSDVTSLHYADGSIRVRHPCKEVDGDRLYSAPALQLAGGHRVVQADPLTITPSILCADCGLHGFITNGVWTA